MIGHALKVNNKKLPIRGKFILQIHTLLHHITSQFTEETIQVERNRLEPFPKNPNPKRLWRRRTLLDRLLRPIPTLEV